MQTYMKFKLAAAIFAVSAVYLPSAALAEEKKVPSSKPVIIEKKVDGNAEVTREAIVQRLSALQSLRGQFTQTLESKDGKTLQETAGDFTFKRPGFYHWESNDPFPQTVVGNGETVWIYDPDLEQVTIAKQDSMPYNPANLLSGGIADLAARYHVLQLIEGGVERYTLMPIDAANAPFVQLGVNFKGDILQAATLTDRLGQVTRIRFDDTKVNLKVDDKLFTFMPPEGTDILMND